MCMLARPGWQLEKDIDVHSEQMQLLILCQHPTQGAQTVILDLYAMASLTCRCILQKAGDLLLNTMQPARKVQRMTCMQAYEC